MDPKEYYLSKPWLTYYPDGVPAEVDVPADFRSGTFRSDGRQVQQQNRVDFLRP